MALNKITGGDLYSLNINQSESWPLSIHLDKEDYELLKSKFEQKGFPFKEEILNRKVGVLNKIHINLEELCRNIVDLIK